MGPSDIIWMILIISGAVYLLYRSVWKKKGHCHGCESGACSGSPGGKTANPPAAMGAGRKNGREHACSDKCAPGGHGGAR